MKLSGGISGFIQDEQGFTAIELITVILIIGILLASVFAKYHDVKIGVSTTVCHTNQLALEKAETLYYTNCVLQRTTGHYATEIIDLVPYLVDRAIPHCPEDGTYILQEDGHAICSLPAHQR